MISFGSIWPFWYPTVFPLSSSSYYYGLEQISGVIAPFWNNVDVQREGSVSYKVYMVGENSKSDELIGRVSEFVSANDERASNFSGTWMLVVDWNSVPPSPQYYQHYYLYYYWRSVPSSNRYYWYYRYYNSYYYNYYRQYYSRLLEYFSKVYKKFAVEIHIVILNDAYLTEEYFSSHCNYRQHRNIYSIFIWL